MKRQTCIFSYNFNTTHNDR